MMKRLCPDYIYREDLFHVRKDDEIGEDWFILWHSGNDSFDGRDYAISTNHRKADEIPEEVMGAADTAELMVKLLNLYFRGALYIGDPDQIELELKG